MSRAAAIGRANKSKGKTAEEIAKYLLINYGVRMVEKIATPINVIARRPDGFVRIVYAEPVSGDIRGILPGGRRVLCEVKARDRNLRKSDFEDHQIQALSDNQELGGLSVVAWIHPEGNLLLTWPPPGFIGNGRASITFKDAKDIALLGGITWR